MVEPPTQVVEEQSESEEQSPPQTQVLRFDPNQGAPTDSAHEHRYRTRTPELQKPQSQKSEVQRSPNSEAHLAPFDWDEFEARYEKALKEADEREMALLDEFDRLVKGLFKSLESRRQAEIDSFHESHFSNAAVELFKAEFLTPGNAPENEHFCDDYYYDGYEEEDDGLGYYPDGVKRTLTDEQIAIFRHSEIESLRRAQSKIDKTRAESAAMLQASRVGDQTAVAEDDDGELRAASEDGELESEKPTAAELRRMKRKRAKQSKKEKRKFQPEQKEDLRKRTWDKVEAGMDSLDYDGLETAYDATSNHTAQRRRISYED
ncbi:hypothetical protein DL771_003654 [Monosporascus sp. 5C6A]|nr:hypothetical protein DL771_003654 [Monosporascus sp. 5C6A]